MKVKLWNKERCCCCLSLKTGTKYFVLTNFITIGYWTVYFITFMFLNYNDLDEKTLYFYSAFAPFFKQGESLVDKIYNYEVLKSLLILSVA